MASPATTVERAFELARGGVCLNMDDLRRTLKAEKYEGIDAHLGSGSLSRQLRSLIKSAHPTAR